MKITGLCMVLLSQVLTKIEDRYPFSVCLSLTTKTVLQNVSHISKSTKTTKFLYKMPPQQLNLFSEDHLPVQDLSPQILAIFELHV